MSFSFLPFFYELISLKWNLIFLRSGASDSGGDWAKTAFTFLGGLIIAITVFEINRRKERNRIIQEWKNETVKICDELRMCDSMLRLNHETQEYHKALAMLYKAKENKAVNDIEKENSKFYYAMQISQAEHFQTRTNDYVQKYNEKESELLKLVSTLHYKITDGIKLKRLWHELNIRDVSFQNYNFHQYAVKGDFEKSLRVYQHVHSQIQTRLQNTLQHKRSIKAIYQIQQLLNPKFFPIKNKRPKTRLQKAKRYIIYHILKSRPTSRQTRKK